MPAFGRVSSKIELTVVSSKRLNPVVKVGKSKRLTRHEAYLKPDQKEKTRVFLASTHVYRFHYAYINVEWKTLGNTRLVWHWSHPSLGLLNHDWLSKNWKTLQRLPRKTHIKRWLWNMFVLEMPVCGVPAWFSRGSWKFTRMFQRAIFDSQRI